MCWATRPIDPAARRSAAPVRPADGGRRRALLLPALLLAGLGHRHRGLRAGRSQTRRHAGACGSAADWLLREEIRRKGDWSVKRPDTEPSGWAFEFRNEFYPDIDDTAMVLLALSQRARLRRRRRSRRAEQRALDWLLAMQSSDGGWAAFDVDNNWEFLSHVPFADHNAMLDPTCPDITGRVLEALARARLRPRASGRAARRRLAGAQSGARRKLVRPLGRGLHLRHLLRAARPGAPRARATARRTCCAPANGCAPFRTPTAAGAKAAPATTTAASSPARARPRRPPGRILGLIAGGDADSLSVQHGIEYLLETQRPDGSWDEELGHRTGFPKVFYLNYHLYRDYFPLLALSAFVKARAGYRMDSL